MREVALADVMSPTREAVRLDPEGEYATVGTLNFGRGLFARPVVRGSEVSYPTYYRIAANQFIYSKLFAWEGALTVVPPCFDGYFVSQEFPTFEVKREVALPSYLRLLTTWPELWERVRSGETGMGGRRKRVHPERLLAVTVPLPSLDEQARIVDLLDAVDRIGRSAAQLASAVAAVDSAATDALIARLATAATVELGQIADVVGGVTKDSKKEQDGFVEVPYLRVANVQRGYLDLTEMSTIRAPTTKVEKLQLIQGDVLFNEGGDRDKLGRGWVWESQLPTCIHQNHVFRARVHDSAFDPYFVSIWGNSHFGQRWFEEMGSQTTNLASINMRTLRAFPIPVIGREDQLGVVETNRALGGVAAAATSQASAAADLRACLLGELLSGSSAIPNSYDELLVRVS